MARTTFQDRMKIHQLAESGYSDRQIAQQVGWSVPTVRTWRRQAQRLGRKGLCARLGRPATGVISTFPAAVGQTLRAWRTDHPGWGPKTLRTQLQSHFADPPLPSQASIALWLKQEGLTRSYQKHSPLPPLPALAAQAPHQLWQMDARGYQYMPEVGVIALINLSDIFSRVKLLSYPCYLGQQRASRHPTTEDYQVVLRLAFTEWGLPDRLATDHDSVFYDNLSPSPFPTRLHLWLVALGVELTFARMHRPTDQAIIERSHQTWYQQVVEGQQLSGWQALYDALKRRRDFLNHQLPCATLGERAPLAAHPGARLARRPYRPEWETELLDVSRVFSYLSQGRWFRLVSSAGTVAVGGQIYCVGRHWAKAPSGNYFRCH